MNNYNQLSLLRSSLKRFPTPFSAGSRHRDPYPGRTEARPRGDTDAYRTLVASCIVTRVRPRTSKGITDLLLPLTSVRYF